jgi:hypothetical protein
VKWEFPRKAANKVRHIWGITCKGFKRYFRKEGGQLLVQDARNLGDSIGDRVDRKQEHLDPIYTRPIHRPAAQDTEDLVLTRGRMDHGFLFIVISLCLFGVVMAFSASSVYAAQYHDDSTYYLKRHLLYLVLALIPTIPAILLAKPWFWRFFGVFSYGVSVVLL